MSCTCGSAARPGATHRPDCPALNLVGLLSSALGADKGEMIGQVMGLAAEVLEHVSSKGEERTLEAGAVIQACLWAAVLAGREFGSHMTPDERSKQLHSDLDVAIGCIADGFQRGWFETRRVPR